MRFIIAVTLLFCFAFFGGVVARGSSSSSVSLFSSLPDYTDYTFEHFVTEYGKKYHSAESRLKHRRIFYENLRNIKHHNSRLSSTGHTYYQKINKYSDLHPSEIIAKYTGRSKRLAAKKHLHSGMIDYSSPIEALENDLPASVDWRNKGAVTPVKDQGGCGSCWAHSAVESIESYFYLSTGSTVILSPQHVLECTPNPDHCGGTGGCEGATAELAFAWARNGVATEDTIPYQGVDATCPARVQTAVKVGGYVTLPQNNATALLEAVAFLGPISVNVDANSWSAYGGGVFNGCNLTNSDINHVVQLVGYGHDSASNQDYWLVRNSWGPSWGENGYIRLYRGPNEVCAVDTQPQDGTACSGQTQPIKVCGTCGIWYDSSYPTQVTKY